MFEITSKLKQEGLPRLDKVLQRHSSIIQRFPQHLQKWLSFRKIQLLVKYPKPVQIFIIGIDMPVIMLLRLHIPRNRPQFIGQKPLFEQSAGTAVAVVERVNADK